MALHMSQRGRLRSSTGTSRALSAHEQASSTADLIRKLTFHPAASSTDELARLSDVAKKLRLNLRDDDDTTARDVFRRGGGFQSILDLLGDAQRLGCRNGPERKNAAAFVNDTLLLLGESLSDHRGNEWYFIHIDGWSHLRRAMEGIQDALSGIDGTVEGMETISDLHMSLLTLSMEVDAVSEEGSEFEGVLVERDGETSDLRTIQYIRHPHAAETAVALVVRLLTGANESNDNDGRVTAATKSLGRVKTIANRNLHNTLALWQAGVLSDVLKLTLDARMHTEIKSAAHDLTLSLAEFGLDDLDDVASLFKRAYESDDARALLSTILDKSKGPPFVQFDLSRFGYSSIELPSLPRAFPPATGYTLTAWVRIDDFDNNCHTTLFGAFDVTQTCFVLIYLEKDSHQLILQTSVRSSRPSVRFPSTCFETGGWYHIALVHRKSTADPRQSSAVLFVNGEFAEQLKCAYPLAPPEYEVKYAKGSPTPASPHGAKPVQAFFGTPHDLAFGVGRNEVHSRWSLASAHMYATPFTDEFVAVQYRLGPQYYGNMQDSMGPFLTYRASAELNWYNELLHPERDERSDIVTATEGRACEVVPESRLLLAISPSTIISPDSNTSNVLTASYELGRKALARYQQLAQKTRSIAMNGAVPVINEAIIRSYGTGILTGDPAIAVPKPVDDATWCLSGTLALLVRLLESANSKAAFLQAVQIYLGCFKDNWRTSEAMERGSGFGTLAMIIREKLGFESGLSAYAISRRPAPMLSLEDRQSLPSELLPLLLDFVGYNSSKPEDSMIVNPMAYRVFLVDFDTWRRCDIETQKLYYAQFVHFVTSNRHQGFNHKRLTRMRVVKKLIDALKSEEISAEAVGQLMDALRALVDHHLAYRELAMFVVFGLQDERAVATRPMRSMASMVNFRQRAASWARTARGSRSTAPGTTGASPHRHQLGLSRAELAVNVLALLTDIICNERGTSGVRRFNKAVPNRWLVHLLAETDPRVISMTVRIISRSLAVAGSEFKAPFIDKNGGFITLKSRLKGYWRVPSLWLSCFAILFGQETPSMPEDKGLSVYFLIEAFSVGETLVVTHPEILLTLTNMLEAGLRAADMDQELSDAETSLLKTVIQFFSELYGRSPAFRHFATATESRYIQSLLFVLYPLLVGSDRLSAEMELQAEKESLTFKGEEVKLRPHSNSLGERPPSVRSLNSENGRQTPSPQPTTTMRVDRPRRISSFVMIRGAANPAHFNPALAPKKAGPVRINVANDLVESLLEVAINLFIDIICYREKFVGIGLFHKVPPGFREHQAYFQSYIFVNTLSQLLNHLKLNQELFLQANVLTTLSRFSSYMSEAVFEGWFIDGAQPMLDFTGQVLEYLQQPRIAENKTVRLCSQHISNIRILFLRVILWRLSELEERESGVETVAFLDKMNYWQIILFSSENQETFFIRLICFQLYLKLTSQIRAVRLAAARLWRTVLVQKPTVSATLLTQAVGSDERHLSTGFMKLVSLEDEEFIEWIDENRNMLDPAFINSLNKPWDEFVSDENKRNESTAKLRLERRREKLRTLQTEEETDDDILHRYEVSTNVWRTNVHSQERVKMQRAIQDHQENINHLYAVFAKIERITKQPCGLEPPEGVTKWQLDETEALNRMRTRLVPDTGEKNILQPKRKGSERIQSNGKLALNTQVPRITNNITSAFPKSPTAVETDGRHGTMEGSRARADSVSNSQLLEGGFEMVDDPNQDEDGAVEDKNRKIMTRLQRGDGVVNLYNTSRIIGLEACEGLVVIGRKCLYLQDNYFQRSDGEIVSASQAPEDERDPYVQLISGKDVGSAKTRHSIGDQETRHWNWTEVLSISKRRFLFRDVSVEIFFTDGRSYLLTCVSPQKRDALYSEIVSKAPHVHSTSSVASEDAWRLDTLRNPEEAPQSLTTKFATVFNGAPTYAATKKWVKGEMSNFQYLMLINTMAGRTFNDLTQYPVFPWVLADYTSEELDLENPRTFRNFAKPMGCQTPAREAEFRERYSQFAEMGDESSPPFHYGTHYSSAMIVSSYLIRLQPFVQSYLLLQGGNFDHADRLFDSISKTWLSASRDNMSDVRELTPEFFYLPEFLMNINNYDFGVKQGGGAAVHDVELPPWAKGDPHIFIKKHREALESKCVSEHLHEWVDLIFGYKQRGEPAIEATNVFGHLSYQGARDLDTIGDQVERLATIGIIHSFGQTPHQVFQRPHPARESSKSAVARLDTLAESLVRLPDPLFEDDEKVAGLTFSPTVSRLLVNAPCKLNLLPNCDRFLQWGFADHSVRFFSSNTKRLLGLHEHTHIGPITTAVFPDSKTLVTAGADCTIALWTVDATRDLIELHPKTYLFGHRKPVTLLAASRVFSTLLSVSADGQVVLWGLNSFNCIRVLLPAGNNPVQAAKMSNITGHIVLCQGSNVLVYTLNGHLLVKQRICEIEGDVMTCCAFYEGASNEWLERELIFTGHMHGVANIWSLVTSPDGGWHLKLLKRLNHTDAKREDGGNSSAAVTAILPMPFAVYTGDENGGVWEWDCIQRQTSIGIRGR